MPDCDFPPRQSEALPKLQYLFKKLRRTQHIFQIRLIFRKNPLVDLIVKGKRTQIILHFFRQILCVAYCRQRIPLLIRIQRDGDLPGIQLNQPGRQVIPGIFTGSSSPSKISKRLFERDSSGVNSEPARRDNAFPKDPDRSFQKPYPPAEFPRPVHPRKKW